MTSTPGEPPARDAGVSVVGAAGAGGRAAAAPRGAPGRGRRALAGAALLLAALPALFYLCLAPRSGRLQWHDYYIVLAGMVEGEQLTGRVGRWLTIKSNEHTVTVPALVYAANLALFRGDNRPLAAAAVLAQLAVVLLLFLSAPADLRQRPLAAGLAAAVISALAFTPAGSHQFFLGFSGVMWVIADLLAVLAIVALQRSGSSPRPARWVGLALGAGALGVVTFSTTLAVWPALLLGSLLLPRGRRRLPELALGALVVGHLAAALYRRPAHHPSLELADASVLASFVALFLGWIFTTARTLAMAVGWIGMAGAAATWTAAWRMRDAGDRREMMPWLMLQLYALGNAGMAAVTRAGFGPGAAAQARYGLLTALFWIGVLGAGGVLVWRFSPRGRRALWGGCLAAVAALAIGATWRSGAGIARGILADAAWHPVAEIAVRRGIADDWSCRHFLNAGAQSFLDGVGAGLRPFMTARRHVPFDRVPDPGFGAVLTPEERAGGPASDLAGDVVRVTPLAGGVVRVEGWVDPGRGEIDGALVVAADGAVRGEMVALPRVPGAPRDRGAGAVVVAGYAAARSPGEPLQVVVRRRADRRFYPVGTAWTR